jgi:hypothetical protein
MKQKINFFQEEFKKPAIKFPAMTLLYLVGLLIALCVMFISYRYWVLYSSDKILFEINQHNEKLMAEISLLENKLKVPKINNDLKDKLEGILKINTQKRQLLTYINKVNFDSNMNGSHYYEALQRNDVSGIWLTEITITDNAGNISVRGVAKVASELPVYIDKLKNYPVFSKKPYYSLVLDKQKNEPHFIDFYFTSMKIENEKRI